MLIPFHQPAGGIPPARARRRAGRPCAAAVLALAAVLPLAASTAGCLSVSGPRGLERLLEQRGEPDRVTVFARAPGDGELPLAELAESLRYWCGPTARGTPRWQHALVPEPPDLYERLLGHIADGAERVLLEAHHYDSMGLDRITLVDYRLGDGTLVGFDHVPYVGRSPPPRRRWFLGYEEMRWWEYPLLVLDVPISTAIGIKELVAELVKSPFSFGEVALVSAPMERRNPLAPATLGRGVGAFVADWREGFLALTWRLRVRQREGIVGSLRELLAAIPLVGSIFDAKSPPPDLPAQGEPHLVAVSQGIHAGDARSQFLEPWRAHIDDGRPGARVVVAPYRYGSAVDVAWSVLNLSHGFAYEMADQIACNWDVEPGERVDLAGFSGGAQRAFVASRALRRAGIGVERAIGVAGPAGAFSCARQSTLLLVEPSWHDPVVVAARVVELFTVFPLNANVRGVREADGHHSTPYLPDGYLRAPSLGYAAELEEALRP